MALVNKDLLAKTPKEVLSFKIVWYCFILSFSGGLHGFNTSNVSGVLAMVPFKTYFGFNTKSKAEVTNLNGWITSSLLLGSCVGALMCAPVTDRLGRKMSLAIFSLIFSLSAILMSANPRGSSGVAIFIAGRVISGLGSGAASVIGTGYIAEIAPKSIRGGLAAMYNANTMLGVALGYWINFGSIEHIPRTKNAQWQVPMGVQALPGILLVAGLLLIPESPRWLVARNRIEEAQLSLTRLRSLPIDHEFVRDEFNEIQDTATAEAELNAGRSWAITREIWTPTIRKRLILVMAIQVFFQFSGGNIITYYNTSILTSIGLKSQQANYLFSGIYGLVKFLTVCLYSGFLIDRFGRRPMLFTGSAMLIGCLTYLAAYLALANPAAHASNSPAASGWVAVVAIYIFAIGYAFSWATIPWIINAEVFPTKIRATCMSICITWQYLINFALTRAQPNMVVTIHPWGPFALFACVTAVATVYCYFCLPETKGLSMEHMDQLFDVPWYRVGIASLQIIKDNQNGVAPSQRGPLKFADEESLEKNSKCVYDEVKK
ncbi:general substrate transporter [Aaosphaeria arxii CBS 175.79]|uniref:General substrate transporter n=1 Tax=Aaosphaeria arxii CBS 175.79 TaxID=1450172 RepID=A0A6A5XPC2_9PLEO|nr:general substrate transporter [Aaosphaeria arxii CBS 175.79]KAF2014992.1 general substrate transporter [Aaosphaeria arxii CBS 175.79]